MTKVHKYVLRRLFREEYVRWIGQFGGNPLAGLKSALNANKIKYEVVDENEITILAGTKKLRVKQED